jgi:hypothetical protein
MLEIGLARQLTGREWLHPHETCTPLDQSVNEKIYQLNIPFFCHDVTSASLWNISPRITSQISNLRHNPRKKVPDQRHSLHPTFPAKLLKSIPTIPIHTNTTFIYTSSLQPQLQLTSAPPKNEHTQPHPTPPRTLPPPSPPRISTPPHRRPRLYTPLACDSALTQRFCFLFHLCHLNLNTRNRRSKNNTRGGEHSGTGVMAPRL